MNRFHVITGAPGTGKTAILDAVAGRFPVVPEPARRVLAEWRKEGNPRPARMEPDLMISRMTMLAIQDHEAARTQEGPVVFDRGVVDCAAYAHHLGRDIIGPVAALAEHRYNGHVLLTTPWRDIYTTDDERTMDFEDVERFHDAVVRTYLEAGYELVVVPTAPLAHRVEFVRRHIEAGD